MSPGYRNAIARCPLANSIPFGDECENGIYPDGGVAIFKWEEGAELAALAWWGKTSVVKAGEDTDIKGADGAWLVPLPDELNEFAQRFDEGLFPEYELRSK